MDSELSNRLIMKKRAVIIKKSVWLLLLLAAAICCIYASKKPYFRVKWQDKSFTSKQGLFLDLTAKKVTLKAADGSILWQSEKKLRVQDAFIEDVDIDGDEELILLLWTMRTKRTGRIAYGAFRVTV